MIDTRNEIDTDTGYGTGTEKKLIIPVPGIPGLLDFSPPPATGPSIF
jgi:hypothetical protein